MSVQPSGGPRPDGTRTDFLTAERATVISAARASRRFYVPVPYKLAFVIAFASCWLAVSVYFAVDWIRDLAPVLTLPIAIMVVAGVGLIPGAANAFMIAGLLVDRRPTFRLKSPPPAVTLLIAAYNEEGAILETLESLALQRYGSPIEILVIDDGSRDRTREIVRSFIAKGEFPTNQTVRLIEMPQNGGKARALNAGLAQASHQLIVTLDADTWIFRDALARLIANQMSSPEGTASTAGAVLVRNSRKNLLTRLQEWDYFLGISVVKRVQSLLQGTLVAQGAFSIYRREVLEEVGGWQDTLGEDIVLTWSMIERGYRIGYAENAYVFTNVPETMGAFYRQRKRWSRGLIEAFKQHPNVLLPTRLNVPFVYLNLLFPFLDAIYLFAFLPGVIAAVFFHSFLIVGWLTLLVLPLGILCNSLMYLKQLQLFRENGLKVRRNIIGAIVFTTAYQVILAPASLAGYLAEFVKLRKLW